MTAWSLLAAGARGTSHEDVADRRANWRDLRGIVGGILGADFGATLSPASLKAQHALADGVTYGVIGLVVSALLGQSGA